MSALTASYREHGPKVVNLANQMADLLYGARSRLELTQDAFAHGETDKAAMHAMRRGEYAGDLRRLINHFGEVGREAYRLAKQMEARGGHEHG